MASRFADWIVAYERAWRSEGTDAALALFTPDAVYRPAPFEEPVRGHRELATFWEAEREGPDEDFTFASELIAEEGDTAVARIEVMYDGSAERTYRDLWVITLNADDRCSSFEEWPFSRGSRWLRPRHSRRYWGVAVPAWVAISLTSSTLAPQGADGAVGVDVGAPRQFDDGRTS